MKILHVEDNSDDADIMERMLNRLWKKKPEIVHVVRLGQAMVEAINTEFDLIILDPGLPDSVGHATVDVMIRRARTTPMIVVTGFPSQTMAAEAGRLGVSEYLAKGQLNDDALAAAIWRATKAKHQSKGKSGRL